MFILVAASLVSHMGSFMTFLFFCNHQKFWCVQELEPMTQVRENCFIPRREVGEIFITKKWPVKMVRLCFCWLILKIIWYIYIFMKCHGFLLTFNPDLIYFMDKHDIIIVFLSLPTKTSRGFWKPMFSLTDLSVPVPWFCSPSNDSMPGFTLTGQWQPWQQAL